ncbi:MAG TPA: MFS transporter [Solirubrobacteraceae bacterium]|nr:MFS transporter [Solirubrobacteraceae bacterium]
MSKHSGGNMNDMSSMLEAVRTNVLTTARRDRTDSAKRRYVMVLGTAVLCYAALGTVLGILPNYVHSLGGGAVMVGLAVGAPALTGAAGRPLGGRLADRVGPARIVIIGALVMTLGTIPAFVPSLPVLILSRLLVGAGEAAMMAATVLWLLRLAGPERRGRAMGHVGLANYAGLTVGPPLSQLLSGDAHPIRVWIAAAILPLVAAGFAAAMAGTPEARSEPGQAREQEQADAGEQISAWRVTLRPGLGLMLVNFGYVALLSFGAAAATQQGSGIAKFVIPVFGIGVILSRTVLAGVPDRFGPARTLSIAVVLESAGLVGLAAASGPPLALVALLVMSLGQGLAVPSLGLLALASVPPSRHGRTAGAFFAYFDAGVGLGGPAVGVAARAADPTGALFAAAVAVLITAPIALLSRRAT